MTRTEILRRTELFASLSPADLEAVAERALPKAYGRGDVVFLEGERGDAVFVIVAGAVKIFVTSPEGDELVLATLGVGDAFGELSLMDGGARSASAAAVETTDVLAVTRSTLLGLMRDRPEFAESFLRVLGGLLRRLTGQAGDLVFLDLPARVAKALLREAGDPSGELVEVDLPLTQSDLAALAGGTRQTVNAILQRFARDGAVVLQGGRVVAMRPDALRAHAGL